ncbi:helix-turn-helix domain-containing protein [Thioalkalivibrio sp. ALJ16]|uniref:helix-turn-helix domain-containing protein n=1 Tax=Thioalkalivibrio sp. ALJ16 TaxID=1158762 RepID=UPI00037EE1D5|nr:helix-turn-helix domain-containing protein [Thioalkalivibrio sp. ALJ16]
MSEPRDKEPGLGRVDEVDDSVTHVESLRPETADPEPSFSAASGLTSRDQPAASAPEQGSGEGEPGASLRRAREAAGLDTASLARRIHLGRGTLEDLEANRFQHMPPAYVRGYLRSCARELGVNADPWIAAFEQHGLMEPELRAVATPSARGRQRRRGRGIYWLALLLVLGLLGLGVYAWTERGDSLGLPALNLGDTREAPRSEPGDEAPADTVSSETETPAAAPEAAAEPEAPSEQEAEASTDTVPADARVAAEALAEPVAPPQPEPAEPARVAPEPVEAPAPADTAAHPGTGATLVLEFSETSWVEVRDAADEVVLTGVLSQGDREELRLELPARVVLGNAAGVSLNLDGEAFDLEPHVRSDRTARFDLER